MPEFEDKSFEKMEEFRAEARARLRVMVYEATKPVGRSRKAKALSWMQMSLTVIFALEGIFFLGGFAPRIKEATGVPDRVIGITLIMASLSILSAWHRWRIIFDDRRRLSRLVEMYINSLERSADQSIQVSSQAAAAAGARHESNRRRKGHAMLHYWSHTWKSQATAARSIADTFNVTEKVAARWVAEWKKQGNPASQSGYSCGEE